jgi:serine O-acetyltransferase
VITSLSVDDLSDYVRRQANHIFPDSVRIARGELKVAIKSACDRMEHCYKRISAKRYFFDQQACFDHLYSDQYLMFLWFLSSSQWQLTGETPAVNKLYLLNKALHGFDCSFSTALPSIFIIVHGTGTVLGKAKYSDYLTVYHGCTVGQSHGQYPQIGSGVGLGTGASLLGNCEIGQNVSVGAGCTLVNSRIIDGSSVYRSRDGQLRVEKTTFGSISSEYFFPEYLSVSEDQ